MHIQYTPSADMEKVIYFRCKNNLAFLIQSVFAVLIVWHYFQFKVCDIVTVACGLFMSSCDSVGGGVMLVDFDAVDRVYCRAL